MTDKPFFVLFFAWQSKEESLLEVLTQLCLQKVYNLNAFFTQAIKGALKGMKLRVFLLSLVNRSHHKYSKIKITDKTLCQDLLLNQRDTHLLSQTHYFYTWIKRRVCRTNSLQQKTPWIEGRSSFSSLSLICCCCHCHFLSGFSFIHNVMQSWESKARRSLNANLSLRSCENSFKT